MLDILVRNATVYDGSGGEPYVGCIGVRDGKIAFVRRGKAEEPALEVVQADGLCAAPGFIDMHSHGDLDLLSDGRALSAVQQGVTTLVIGNCGFSAAPVEDPRAFADYWKAALGREAGVEVTWRTLGDYAEAFQERKIGVNVVPLVGHGTLRFAVMGFRRERPGDEELHRMRQLVEQSVLMGAWGLSSGLIYVPGCYAETDELVALCEPVARHGGLYASHIRGENDTLFAALQEAVEIGARAGVRTQISHVKVMGRHMWGKSDSVISLLEEARASGIDVAADQYPYEASATKLSAFLPPWVYEGGPQEATRRLGDPELRVCAREQVEGEGCEGWISLWKGVGWENVMISDAPDASLLGRTVAELAASASKDPFNVVCDLLVTHRHQVRVVYFTICESDLMALLKWRWTAIGSDAGVPPADRAGRPHPRTFGTFVRVLGRYARDKDVLSMQEAVRRMTGLPAQRIGLKDRGVLRAGFWADLVLFDEGTVGDTATYAEPCSFPSGVKMVLVNGRVVVRDGEHTGALPGQVLLRSASEQG